MELKLNKLMAKVKGKANSKLYLSGIEIRSLFCLSLLRVVTPNCTLVELKCSCLSYTWSNYSLQIVPWYSLKYGEVRWVLSLNSQAKNLPSEGGGLDSPVSEITIHRAIFC